MRGLQTAKGSARRCEAVRGGARRCEAHLVVVARRREVLLADGLVDVADAARPRVEHGHQTRGRVVQDVEDREPVLESGWGDMR